MQMKRPVRIVVIFALFLAGFLAGGVFAHGQIANPPVTMYGTAKAGDRIEALIKGRVCAQATAGADGFWKMRIPSGGKCGAKEGDTIRFTLNGSPTPEFEVWESGGVPKVVRTGVVLTTYEQKALAKGSGLIYPGSPWIVVMLGAFTLAGIAGMRAIKTRLPGG